MVDKLKEYTGEVIPSESSNAPEGFTEYTGEVLDPLTPDYSFGQLAGKAFDRGLERFKSTYGDVLPAMTLSALGFDEAAKRQMEEARQSEEYIQRTMRPQFPSFRDVNWANPLDISKFIVETTGEQVVNLAGVLVPGGIGAKGGEMLLTNKALKTLAPKITDKAKKKVVKEYLKTTPAVARGRNIGQLSGIFLGSYGLNAPEVFRNIYEQTGSFEPGAAALAGVVNASLDSILPATLLNQFSRPGRATIVSEILERSGMSPNLARKAVVQIAGSGVLEGLTEATQEAVSITAENFVQEHSFLFDSEDFERMLEGGVRGTVAGGTFRGVGVAANKLRDKYNKFIEGKKDAEEGDTGDTGDTGDETPPTTTPPKRPLEEQLELNLEGGMGQPQLTGLDLDPAGTAPEQLQLDLGDTTLSVPDPAQVDPRQGELDFDAEPQPQVDPSLVGPPSPQRDLFDPDPVAQPVQGELNLEGGFAQPELTGLEPIPFRRTEEEQLDSAEPRLTEREVIIRAKTLEYNIANAFVPNPSNIAELQKLKDTYPEVFAERDFVSSQLGMERFEIPYEGGFKNVTKLSDTLLTNLPSPETERQGFGGSSQTGPALYNTLAQNYRGKISDKKLSAVYEFMEPVIRGALRLNGTVRPDDILIEDANDIPVASVLGSMRKATPEETERLLRNASRDELLKSKTIGKELYNDPEFRFAPLNPDRLAGARISKPKTPLVYFPAAYYMEQIASVDKKGADALIEAAISKAKNAGVRYLVAEDFTSTQALNAFRNRGFKDATKYLFKGEALDSPVDFGGDIKRKRGIIKKNLYLDIEADVKPKKPIPPVNPKKNVITVPAGTPIYHGSSSQVEGIMSSRTLQAIYTGTAVGDGGGLITEGGLVWFSKKKEWAAQYGGGADEATIFSYTPKQDLNLLNRESTMSKKQADILNEIMMPRFGFSQAEINAVKKGGRYVKGMYGDNPFGVGTDVIAGKGRSFENYITEIMQADYGRQRVITAYEKGPIFDTNEGLPGEPKIIRETFYSVWPLVLPPLGYDGFFYGEEQYALVGNRRVEFVQEPKVKKKLTERDKIVKEAERVKGRKNIEKPLKSIRKGNPADEKIINKLKTKKTLGPVLNILKRSDITPAQKELATLLLTIPNISKTDFKVIENLEFQDNAYGEYIRQKDLIQISNNADVETVLHEAVHAATANLLNKHIRDGVGITNLGRRIVRLYEEAIAADVNGRFATELSSVDEFIAESFAGKDFQKFLARTESATSARGEDEAYRQSLISQGVRPNVIQNIMRERAGVGRLLKSLWGRFVNAIRDMLGIEDVNFSYSLLNDVIGLAPELFVGPNKREQAGATQEILFKKTDVVEEVLASGNAVPKYTKEAKIPKNIQQIAEIIGRQSFADNSIGRQLVSRLSNLPQSILNLYAGILSIPQQIELFGERLPALNDVRRILQSKAFEIKQGREDIERIVAYGETLKKKYLATPQGKKTLEEWNKVLLELSGLDINPETILADPNGLTNLAEENAKGAALVRRYEKLPKDLKDYANQIVTDLKTRYNLLLETVLAANPNASDKFKNDLRERFKARPYYLPFIRRGEFWFEYKTRDGEYGISSTDSEASRTLLIEKMQREEGITDVKLVTKDSVIKQRGNPSEDKAQFMTSLKETIGALQENESIALNNKQISKINEIIEETYLALFPEQSLRNNQRTRQAIPGYIEDIIFAYANVAPKIESSMANQKYNNELLMAVNAVARQTNEPEKAPNNLIRAVANDVVGRSDFMINPIAKHYARYAAYGSYFWFLGFNVSSAIVNITQLPLVVLPYLAGEYGGPKLGQGRAFTEMKDAMKLYFEGGFEQNERFAPDRTMAQVKIDLQTGEKTYIGKNAKLFRPGGKYHDLFNRAEDAAALRRGVGYEITELSKDLGEPLETGGRLKAKTEKLVGYLFQNSERLNREVTLVAAFEMEMKYGSGNKDVAIQKAIEFTSKVHSHALPEVGPSFFQDGIGKVAFVFKRFAQAQAYLIIKLFNDGPIGFSRNIKNDPNLTEEEKQQRLAEKQMAKRQLAGIYGYSFLMAGAAGVPAYGLASMIIEGIFDEDDEPFDLDTFISQSVGDMAYRGPLSYAIGADISRRTGFRNLFYQEDPRRLDEVGFATYAAEQIGGPAFAILKRISTAPEFLERGQELRALERVTPTALGNAIKAFRQSMEGVRNKNGTKIVEDDPSLYETFMQVVGFTNPEVSEAYMRAQALKGPEKRLTQRRSSLLLRYWLASQEGDTDAVTNIKDEIREFNKKAPRGLRIKPSTLRRSMKARQKATKDSVFGVNLPETYKDEIEDVYDIDTGNMLDLDIFD